MKIYILEDDEIIRNFVIYALKQQPDFEAVGFELPSEFKKAVKKEVPDIILLDIMLPEEDGLSVLKQLRENSDTKLTPIIMLTAKNTGYDKILGLDSGADDYIAKPFEVMEVIARVKAWARRLKNSSADTGITSDHYEYKIEGLYLCPATHIIKVDGVEITLTLKEFEILCLLIQNKNMVLSREKLFNQVWGYDIERENRTLDVHIRTLRVKLGKYGDLIETVRGIGYKMRDNL